MAGVWSNSLYLSHELGIGIWQQLQRPADTSVAWVVGVSLVRILSIVLLYWRLHLVVEASSH